MAHRFGDPVEHQADTHAGGEEHRKPACVTVVGRGIRTAQSHLADGQNDQQQCEDHDDVGAQYEEPVESLGREVEHRREHGRSLFWQRQRIEDKGHDDAAGNQKHGIVDVQSERSETRFDIVLTDLVVGLDDIRRAFRLRDTL